MAAYIWFPLLGGLANGYLFMNIAPVADQFMKLFGIEYAGLALLIGAVPWSHAATQIPSGVLIDKIGVVRSLLYSSIACLVCCLIPLAAPTSLGLAVGTRFLAGIAVGVVFLSMFKVISYLAPPERMSLAQGVYGGAFGFGTVLPYFTLPYMGEYAWVWSYLIPAGMCAAILAGLWALPRGEMARRREKHDTGAAVGVWTLLASCVRCPDIWMLGVFHGIFSSTLTNLGNWFPSVLADMSGEPIRKYSFFAVVLLFIGSCARMMSGHVVRALSRRRAIYLVLGLLAAFYFGLSLNHWVGVGTGLGLGLAVSCGLCYGAVFTMGAKVLGPMFMGTALGLLNSTANMTNVGITLMFGFIRDHTGSFNTAYAAAGCIAAAVLVATFRRVGRLDARLD